MQDTISDLKFFVRFIHDGTRLGAPDVDGATEGDRLRAITRGAKSKRSKSRRGTLPLPADESKPGKANAKAKAGSQPSAKARAKTAGKAPARKFGADVEDIAAEARTVLRRADAMRFTSSHNLRRAQALGETRAANTSKARAADDPVLQYRFGPDFSTQERQYLLNKYPVAALLLQQGYPVFGEETQISPSRRRELLSGMSAKAPAGWASLDYALISDDHAALFDAGLITSTLPFIRLKAGKAIRGGTDASLDQDMVEGFKARDLPEWFASELASVAAFSQNLDATGELAGNSYWFNDSASSIRAISEALDGAIPQNTTHALLVPWIGKGGGELVSIWHALAIDRAGGHAVMLGTDGGKREWQNRLPASTTYVELPDVLEAASLPGQGLDPEDIKHALSAVLRARGLQAVHVINSYLGFQTLKTRADWGSTKVFVSLFGVGKDSHGLDAGYWLEASDLKGVDRFLTDNSVVPDQRAESFGLAPRQVAAVAYPATATRAYLDVERPDGARPQILWASRLDNEKLPTLVFEIAARMPDVDFNMFGSAVLDSLTLDSAPDNVRIRGAFDGWTSLPDEPFECLLFTSMWEGLPNVTIEALGSGLPIVASNVGAIREVVREDCGVLIDDVFEPDGYVKALRQLLDDPELRREMAANAVAQIETERSVDSFMKRLHQLGYLTRTE